MVSRIPELNMKIKRSAAGEVFLQPIDESPYTWNSLQNDLAGFNLSDDDEMTEDLDGDEKWEDAKEVLPSEPI